MMRQLVDFNNTLLPYSLSTGFELQQGPQNSLIWSFSYQLNDPGKFVQLPPSATSPAWTRQDGLWQRTCFEFFIKPGTGSAYYEFNFSPAGLWQQYRFTNYRQPQPPQASNDFTLSSALWNEKTNTLQGELKSSTTLGKDFHVSINAVIEETSGDKKYLALAHAGEKPDFHLANSFTMKKEV